MNLVQFTDEVAKIIKEYDREQLIRVIHETTRTLPEHKRGDFLMQIRKIATKEEKAINEEKLKELKKEYQRLNQYFDKIETGEIFLREEYNDEYDEWYNSSVDELIYYDPDGIGEKLTEICRFIHKCSDEGQYKFAVTIGRRLFFQEIQTDGEYSSEPLQLDEMVHYGLMDYDLKQAALDTLYACYQTETGEKRTGIMFEIWDTELSMEDLMQYVGGELENFEDFLSGWISYLGRKKGTLAGKLYTEAVQLTNDVDTKWNNARMYVEEHPKMYLEILNDTSLDIAKALQIGQDGIRQIDKKYMVRSAVALKTAEYALESGNHHELVQECYWEAFVSNTNAVNYLRFFLNCDDRIKGKEQLKNIISKHAGKSQTEYGYYNNGELAENRPDANMILFLRFLNGEFIGVLKDGVKCNSALGWSSTFMKEGMALFLLYLYDSENLLPGGYRMLEKIKTACGFSAVKYKEGTLLEGNQDDSALFHSIFREWQKTTSLTEPDRIRILSHLEKMMEKRVAGIMEASRRNYYGECAAYIAAIGEVKELYGEKGGKQIYMSHFANLYPRRTAFKTELKSYGWIKR